MKKSNSKQAGVKKKERNETTNWLACTLPHSKTCFCTFVFRRLILLHSNIFPPYNVCFPYIRTSIDRPKCGIGIHKPKHSSSKIHEEPQVNTTHRAAVTYAFTTMFSTETKVSHKSQTKAMAI